MLLILHILILFLKLHGNKHFDTNLDSTQNILLKKWQILLDEKQTMASNSSESEDDGIKKMDSNSSEEKVERENDEREKGEREENDERKEIEENESEEEKEGEMDLSESLEQVVTTSRPRRRNRRKKQAKVMGELSWRENEGKKKEKKRKREKTSPK